MKPVCWPRGPALYHVLCRLLSNSGWWFFAVTLTLLTKWLKHVLTTAASRHPLKSGWAGSLDNYGTLSNLLPNQPGKTSKRLPSSVCMSYVRSQRPAIKLASCIIYAPCPHDPNGTVEIAVWEQLILPSGYQPPVWVWASDASSRCHHLPGDGIKEHRALSYSPLDTRLPLLGKAEFRKRS